MNHASEHRIFSWASAGKERFSSAVFIQPVKASAPFSCACLLYVMKNWLPFEFTPLFAIETVPRAECCKRHRVRTYCHNPSCSNTTTFRVSLISSANLPPQMLVPPLPVPVGSPPCTINVLMFLRKSVSAATLS